MLKGMLDMMILCPLATGEAHGHAIAKVIERTSEDVVEVEQGSPYPALHRLENRGRGTLMREEQNEPAPILPPPSSRY